MICDKINYIKKKLHVNVIQIGLGRHTELDSIGSNALVQALRVGILCIRKVSKHLDPIFS